MGGVEYRGFLLPRMPLFSTSSSLESRGVSAGGFVIRGPGILRGEATGSSRDGAELAASIFSSISSSSRISMEADLSRPPTSERMLSAEELLLLALTLLAVMAAATSLASVVMMVSSMGLMGISITIICGFFGGTFKSSGVMTWVLNLSESSSLFCLIDLGDLFGDVPLLSPLKTLPLGELSTLLGPFEEGRSSLVMVCVLNRSLSSILLCLDDFEGD